MNLYLYIVVFTLLGVWKTLSKARMLHRIVVISFSIIVSLEHFAYRELYDTECQLSVLSGWLQAFLLFDEHHGAVLEKLILSHLVRKLP
jgi:hypothetical protein